MVEVTSSTYLFEGFISSTRLSNACCEGVLVEAVDEAYTKVSHSAESLCEGDQWLPYFTASTSMCALETVRQSGWVVKMDPPNVTSFVECCVFAVQIDHA